MKFANGVLVRRSGVPERLTFQKFDLSGITGLQAQAKAIYVMISSLFDNAVDQ